MKPVEFSEQTTTLAENQPEYLPLPVFVDSNGEEMISCWKFTWKERMWILFGRRLWLRQLVFGRKLQPQLPQVENPFHGKKDEKLEAEG